MTTISQQNLLTTSAALLAFLIGLYTLVGRERKSPYLINSVFLIFEICIIGVILDVFSFFSTSHEAILKSFGLVCLLIAISISFWNLYKLKILFTYFVDSAHPKHWGVARWLKNNIRNLKGKKSYEYNAHPIDDNLKEGLIDVFRNGSEKYDARLENHKSNVFSSAAIKLTHQGQANDILANLSRFFLDKQFPIQYLTASRHPIEFVSHLKDLYPNEVEWKKAAPLVNVIDAYTPHFGFADSIYYQATRALTSNLGVVYTPSARSYAGLHTAASVAFNKIKKSVNKEVRQPTLLIYEDSYALADLESSDQYRIFIRHVIPSERLWDGMFTVFTETSQPTDDWNLVCSYVCTTLDLSTKNSSTEAESSS